MIAKTGCIVDASFVEVPRQRNSKEENNDIKNGKKPENWENSNKTSHKDTDARWTMKRNISHFGYKNHIKIDIKSKIITSYATTPANVHDSRLIDKLVDKDDNVVYADAGYAGCKDKLPENLKAEICKKGYRNNKLSKNDRCENAEKSKIRCRIEHVFGTMKTSMNNALSIKSIGKKRAEFQVGLINLVYNILRVRFLQTKGCTVSF